MIQYCWKYNDKYIYLNGATATTENAEYKAESIEYAMSIIDSPAKYKNAFETAVLKYIDPEDDYEMYYKIKCGFDVLFKNWDDSIILNTVVPLGEMPEYTGETPEREQDSAYTYTFSAWTPKFSTVTGDCEYMAVYSKTLRDYEISFFNGETLLYSTMLTIGTMPVYSGDTPTKESTAQYDYVFNGWEPELHQVIADEEYKAVFSEELRSYLIEFLNNNELLQSGYTYYGELPVYERETPVKEKDEQSEYLFCGWTPTISAVTQDANYNAVFSATPRMYFVRFINNSGEAEEILQSGYTTYGSTMYYSGDAPEYKGKVEPGYNYSFEGWNPPVTEITKDTDYIAEFTTKKQTFTVNFNMNGHGEQIESQIVEYGDYAIEPTTPIAEGYLFNNWLDENDNVFNFGNTQITSNITLKADWKEDYTEYTVKFFDFDGNILETYTVKSGDKVHYASTNPPVKPNDYDKELKYTFENWNIDGTSDYFGLNDDIVVNDNFNIHPIFDEKSMEWENVGELYLNFNQVTGETFYDGSRLTLSSTTQNTVTLQNGVYKVESGQINLKTTLTSPLNLTLDNSNVFSIYHKLLSLSDEVNFEQTASRESSRELAITITDTENSYFEITNTSIAQPSIEIVVDSECEEAEEGTSYQWKVEATSGTPLIIYKLL